jgi:hypothetical protein
MAGMFRIRTLLLASASLLIAAAPAAAQVPHSLSLAGPPTATVGQPSVLQATGTVSDDPSVFLARYINAYALPTSVVPNCPATYQNALQIKDSTFAQGGQTVALSVPVDGSFSIPLAFTSTASGPFLICAYLHEGVGTDAFASHAVDVAAAPAAVARPGVLAKPKLTRSGRTLVCGRGSWSGAPTAYAYRWTVDGKRKRGAAGRKLRISRKLRGHKIRCSVTATNAAGSKTALSRARRV